MVECVVIMALLILVNVGLASHPKTAKMVCVNQIFFLAFFFANYISSKFTDLLLYLYNLAFSLHLRRFIISPLNMRLFKIIVNLRIFQIVHIFHLSGPLGIQASLLTGLPW